MAKADCIATDTDTDTDLACRFTASSSASASASASDAAREAPLITNSEELKRRVGKQFLAGMNSHLLIAGRLGKPTSADFFRSFVATNALSDRPIRIEGFPNIDQAQIESSSKSGIKMSSRLEEDYYRPYHALLEIIRVGFGLADEPIVSRPGEEIPEDRTNAALNSDSGRLPLNRDDLKKRQRESNVLIDPSSEFAWSLLPLMLTEKSTINESEYRAALVDLKEYLHAEAFLSSDPIRSHWRSGIDQAQRLALISKPTPADSLLLRRGFFASARSGSHKSIPVEEALEAGLGEMFVAKAANLDFEQERFLEGQLRRENLVFGNGMFHLRNSFQNCSWSWLSKIGADPAGVAFTRVGEELLGESGPFDLSLALRSTSRLEKEARSSENLAQGLSPEPSLHDVCTIINSMLWFDTAIGLAERRRFDLDARHVLSGYSTEKAQFASQLTRNLISETARIEHRRARWFDSNQKQKKAPEPERLNLKKNISLPTIDIDQAIDLAGEEADRREDEAAKKEARK